MLLSISWSNVADNLSLTVTLPFLVGCLNCLWLPFCAIKIHPSAFNINRISLTLYLFILQRYKILYQILQKILLLSNLLTDKISYECVTGFQMKHFLATKCPLQFSWTAFCQKMLQVFHGGRIPRNPLGRSAPKTAGHSKVNLSCFSSTNAPWATCGQAHRTTWMMPR